MKIKECNYFGFRHAEVIKRFEGNPIYIGDMCLITGQPVSVYKTESPNREKNHKDYLLLTNAFISGMDQAEMVKHSSHPAILCTECNTVLYSVNRHHFHSCGCSNETFVDGGRDYLRCGGVDLGKIKTGTYDVLTKTWSEK